MEKPLEEIFDFQVIRRYSALVDLNHIDMMPPFVVAHENVIDFITGENPNVIYNKYGVRQAVKRWNKILELISLNSEEIQELKVDRLYVLGFMYPDTYIVSSIVPRLPYVAEVFGVARNGTIMLVRRNRKLYIEVLKKLSRAVIVKPF